MTEKDNEEMFPDEDAKGAASISTVLKDEKPKKEEKPIIEQVIYEKLKNLWDSIDNGHKIGNMNKPYNLYKEILSDYEEHILK